MTSVKMPIQRVTQQSLKRGDGNDMRACIPACFYMLAKASGYMTSGPRSDFDSFAAALDWDNDRTPEQGWIRGRVSRTFREKYGMQVVSWQTNGNTEVSPERIERMIAAGYLKTEREIDFYKKHVVGKRPWEVVAAGYPIILSVLPGFAANTTSHGIIVTSWSEQQVDVIDPDARNPKTQYKPSYVKRHISPAGSCTVVLPKE